MKGEKVSSRCLSTVSLLSMHSKYYTSLSVLNHAQFRQEGQRDKAKDIDNQNCRGKKKKTLPQSASCINLPQSLLSMYVYTV